MRTQSSSALLRPAQFLTRSCWARLDAIVRERDLYSMKWQYQLVRTGLSVCRVTRKQASAWIERLNLSSASMARYFFFFSNICSRSTVTNCIASYRRFFPNSFCALSASRTAKTAANPQWASTAKIPTQIAMIFTNEFNLNPKKLPKVYNAVIPSRRKS